VFLVVHKKLPELDLSASLRAWIYGICIRKASEYRRSASGVSQRLVPPRPPAAMDPTPHPTPEKSPPPEQLEHVIALLDEDKRAVFVLYEIEELTLQEVADAIGCPLQTAYSRLVAARRVVESAMRQPASRRIAV